MYCSNCGKEVSGNFCTHCGQPLAKSKQKLSDTKEWHGNHTETSSDTNQLRFNRVDEALRKKAEAPNLIPDSTNASHANQSGNRDQRIRRETSDIDQIPDIDQLSYHQAVPKQRQPEKKTSKQGDVSSNPYDIFPDLSFLGTPFGVLTENLPTILRHISVGCMILLTIYSALGLFIENSILTSLLNPGSEHDAAFYFYCLTATLILFFGFLSIFWISSRKKIRKGKKTIRRDSGRGLVPFLFFGLLTFFAPYFITHTPTSPEFITGLKEIFQIFFAHNTLNMWLCGIGVVCSVLRGVKFH